MGLSLDLNKGQTLDLSKAAPTLKKAVLGAGWDIAFKSVFETHKQEDFDLDISALLLDNSGKVRTIQDIVWYKNLSVKGVQHTGDNRTGVGEGDDEAIKIQFEDLDPQISKIVFTVTIFDAFNRMQNFGQVRNAFVRLYDEDSQNEVLKYSLTNDFSTETALIVCSLNKTYNGWEFEAIGEGVMGDLNTILQKYS